MGAVLDNQPQQFNVLLIGNNPIELSTVYNKLLELKDKKFIAEIAFDLQTAIKKNLSFKPAFIIIDDNIGPARLKEIIARFSTGKGAEDIPITILKNSNSGTSVEGAQEFVLKNTADGEVIATALLNSRRLKKTQQFLIKSYLHNKKRLKKAIYGF